MKGHRRLTALFLNMYFNIVTKLKKQRPHRPLAVGIFLIALFVPAFSQKMDRVEKGRVHNMLMNVKKAIKNDYYDPNYGGMDLEARFKVAEEKLKATDNLGHAFAIIAQAVMDLNDSHTRFYPPATTSIVDYGWRIKVFGDKAFITAVDKDSDARKKGLTVGDEVLSINDFKLSRPELWKVLYYYESINPRARLTMEVKSPKGEVRKLDMAANVTTLKRKIDLEDTHDLNEAFREGDKLRNLNRHFFKEVGDAMIWKMPTFVFDPKEVGGLVGRANDKKTLILDLRGNGGGYVVTLEKLAGYIFDKDLKIADYKARKPRDPQQSKTEGSKVFKGKLIVLIDGDSASASEIFARLVQLEKRGVVLGDVSAGAVMMSQGVGFDAGVGDSSIAYGMNLTRADVIMSDGKSLEHTGVTPDELLIPTGDDLASLRDPVLARALELSGNPVDAAVAGKFFPPEPFIRRTSNLAFTWAR